MHDLRFLAVSLEEFEDRGERPSPATLAYLLHQSRPESMVDVAEIIVDEPRSLVGAEAACSKPGQVVPVRGADRYGRGRLTVALRGWSGRPRVWCTGSCRRRWRPVASGFLVKNTPSHPAVDQVTRFDKLVTMMRSTCDVVVMTGGTSGIGELAARRLLPACETLLLATNRSQSPPGAVGIDGDLSSLDSVRALANAVIRHGEGRSIDALVLNAGRNFTSGRTVDGFEPNFGINHLAHYLLLRLLMDHLADGAAVLLTTSGTHDPDARTMAAPPVHADARRLATASAGDQVGDVSPRSAYAESKLCNLLTARALAASDLATAKGLKVIAYSPGPTPGTGLMGESGPVLRFLWKGIGPALARIVPRFNTRVDAGDALARLALQQERLPEGRVYALLDRGVLTFPDPARLVRDDTVMRKLWDDSAELVGLAP